MYEIQTLILLFFNKLVRDYILSRKIDFVNSFYQSKKTTRKESPFCFSYIDN